MSSVQPVLSENNAVNVQENSGQIAVGNYVVQIGSIHGGVVNIAMPDQKPRLQPRPSPVLLRPRRFPGLIDRLEESNSATLALSSFQPVEFFAGPGFGKTSLLRHLAHHPTTASYADGVIYQVGRRKAVEDLFQFLFEAFIESDTPYKATEAQVRHLLNEKRALIIIDDLDLEMDEAELLLDAAPNCAFLFGTPKRQLWGEGRPSALKGLPTADALLLLGRELDRELTSEEQMIAPTLCQALKGHPLHLVQVASMIRDGRCTFTDLRDQLQSTAGTEALAAGPVSGFLSEPEQRVVDQLAALDGAPLSIEHLEALTKLPDAKSVVDELLRRRVVQAHSPRYSLTGTLAQSWSRSRDLSSQREGALAYFTDWVTEPSQTPDRLLEESEPVLQTLTWAVRNSRWSEALRLIRAIEGPLSLAGRWGAWSQVLDNGYEAADALSDQAGKALILHQLGTRALGLGDNGGARNFLDQALNLREALGDQAGAAVTRHNLNLLPPPPPPANGSGPADTPPSSPQSFLPIPVSSTSQLALSALVMAGVVSLIAVVLAFVAMGTVLNSSSIPTAAPVSAVFFASVTPTAAVTVTPLPTPSSTPSPTVMPVPLKLVSLDNLDFGAVRVGGRSSVEIVTLTSQGSAPLLIADISRSGTNIDDFEVVANSCLGIELISGENCELGIVYVPTGAGNHTARLVIVDNVDAGSPKSVALFGRGVTSELDLNPGYLSFGEQRVGSSGAAQAVTLANKGSADLNLAGVALTGPDPAEFSLIDSCPTNLAPEISCTIEIFFRPTSVGIRTAIINIPSDAAGSPHAVSVDGVGTTPELGFSPRSLTFNERPVGSSSAVQTINLTNRGLAALRVDGVSLAGNNSSDFSLADRCPSVLRPGEGCSLDVGFRPESAGARSANLTIIHDAAGSPQIIPLTGTGTRPELLIDPGRLTFDAQRLDTVSRAQSILLRNSGLADLNVARIRLTGAAANDFLVTNLCPNTLESDGECLIQVSFAPTVAENRDARLIIDSNDVNAPHSVELRGTTTTAKAEVRLEPGDLDFGNVNVGLTSKGRLTTLTNVGAENLLIQSIAVAGADPDEFRIVSSDCPTSLSANASCTIGLEFQPGDVGARSANLAVTHNADGSPHRVSLTGSGINGQPDLVVSALEVTGPVDVDRESGIIRVPLRVIVLNQGSAPAGIFKISAEYSGGLISPDSVFVVAYQAQSTEDVDGSNSFYPFSRNPLGVERELTFNGTLNFNLNEFGASVVVRLNADSCSGEEFVAAFCRVDESNENNNQSSPVSVTLGPNVF